MTQAEKVEQAKREREMRERIAVQKAKENQKPIVYIDSDGCEVTVTSAGHVFYNVSDWW